MKTKNLFTDMYELREHYFGEEKNSAIRMVQKDVEKAVENENFQIKLRYLLFKLTNYCNSNCVYCSHAVSRAKQEKKHTISNDIIMKTIEDAA